MKSAQPLCIGMVFGQMGRKGLIALVAGPLLEPVNGRGKNGWAICGRG
jgi:hypothetical protein